MTKKDYLIKILEKLREHRSLADGILTLLQETEVDKNILDGMIKIIEEETKKQKSAKNQQKFNQAKEVIKKLQEQEKLEDINNIDNILDQI